MPRLVVHEGWRPLVDAHPQISRIRLNRQEVFKELKTCVRQHGLRVELHTFYAQLAVAQTHDYAVVGFGGNFECARQRFSIDDERVIARGNERLRQAAEYCFAVMLNFAGLSVHYFFGTHHAASKRSANGLVAEANTENRYFPCETLNNRDANSGFLWCAWTGGDYDALGMKLFNFVERDLVISTDFDILAHLAKILRQIKCKGIVVVDEQNHFYSPAAFTTFGSLPHRCAQFAER